MNTLTELVQQAAARWPQRCALVFDATDETLTFADLDRRTNAIAHALIAQGIGKGDRVLVASANRALFPLAWFGILKAGAVMVPVNPAYRLEDARHLVALSEPTAAFCDAERAPLVAALQREAPHLRLVVTSEATPVEGWWKFDAFAASGDERAPDVATTSDDLANIQFTSGTSGLPKGCMLSHHYWLVLARAAREQVIKLGEGDAMLTAQAFSYLDPQWALVLTLMSGARLVVLERFRPAQLFDKIVAHDITFFYCLAAMPLMLLASPPTPAERAHRLRIVMCSAIPAEHHTELEDRFGVPWLEAYGSTEAGFTVGVPRAEQAKTRGSGAIGRPLPHCEATIVNDALAPVEDGAVGELLVRRPGMMLGYWRNPGATAETLHGQWYRTGDLARRDANGLYYLVGRRKDMIRRAGENIAATEVEMVLQRHPDVVMAACIAVPDAMRNEEVRAF